MKNIYLILLFFFIIIVLCISCNREFEFFNGFKYGDKLDNKIINNVTYDNDENDDENENWLDVRHLQRTRPHRKRRKQRRFAQIAQHGHWNRPEIGLRR